MKIDELKKACVVGGGLMGKQIALNAAIYGYDVNITDSVPAVLDKVKTWANEYLGGRVAKGKMSEEQVSEIKSRFHIVPALKDAAEDAGLVIEAIIEDKDIKADFYRTINKLVAKDTVLASNASNLVSSTFKDCVDNPSRLANFHYFNPALVMKLIEVVKGEHTSEETVDFLMEFARRNGKTPIRLNKEVDGFVVSRILRAIKDEAFFLVEQGVCSPQDLDLGVELGLNHPMGPFRLNDLTGIDLTYHLYERRLKESGVKPAGYDIIKSMYEKHEWGRKTGKGFYEYPDKK